MATVALTEKLLREVVDVEEGEAPLPFENPLSVARKTDPVVV